MDVGIYNNGFCMKCSHRDAFHVVPETQCIHSLYRIYHNNKERNHPMESTFEERLAGEVRRYGHLYDSSQRDYKDFLKSNNSWKEISATLGKDEAVCRAKWKYLRDRFAKAKRKIMWARSVDGADGLAAVPRIYKMLFWLDGFIRHREAETNAVSNESDDAPPPNDTKPDEELDAWLTPAKPVSLPETRAHPPPSVAVGWSSCPATEQSATTLVPEAGGSQQAAPRLLSVSTTGASIRQGQAARRLAAKRRRRAVGITGPMRPVASAAAAAVPKGHDDNDMYFFAGTVCSFLRKVPEDRIDDLMLQILKLIREHQK